MKNKLKTISKISILILLGAISLTYCKDKDKSEQFWHEGKRDGSLPTALTPLTFSKIAKEQKPTVVNISTTRTIKDHPQIDSTPFSNRQHPGGSRNPFENFFEQFFGDMPERKFKQKSLGSGVIINKDGYILTNYHVVEDVDEIKVTLANEREFEAKVVGKDKKLDIALIKIDAWKDLPVAVLGDSDKLEVGEWVVAIGNPFGLEHTVTSGIVSAKGRVLGAGPYDDYIQTDASINPGNSGGPLFNLYGEVVGINTAIISEGQGIGFAIPINLVKEVIDDLQKSGEVTRGWLGLVIQKVTPDLAKSFSLSEPKGALVSEVVAGSPAEKGGLERGDIVTKFDGKEINNYSELSHLAAKTKPGSSITLEVMRAGTKKNLTVTLETLPKDEKLALMSTNVLNRLGMKVESINAELQGYLNIEEDKGVVVTMVEPNSPAAEAKIIPGTVILEVNKKPIPDLDTYKKILEASKSGQSLLFFVKQGSRTLYMTITMP